jgi:hypothetical protein
MAGEGTSPFGNVFGETEKSVTIAFLVGKLV